MNINRATIGALGTTGVLLAASLTMLALVSALVTFDGWPSGVGAGSVRGVAVQSAPSEPRLVRAVRGSAASARARARAHRAGGRAGGSTFAASGGGGSLRAAAGGLPAVTPPVPQVPATPPGEGGGSGPTRVIRTNGGRSKPPADDKGPVGHVTCTATTAVSGAAPGAGGTLGTACKIAPSLVQVTSS